MLPCIRRLWQHVTASLSMLTPESAAGVNSAVKARLSSIGTMHEAVSHSEITAKRHPGPDPA